MASTDECLGHGLREATKNKAKLKSSFPANGNIMLIKSLEELEKNYAGEANWKKIEDGEVLSIPVEEFWMIDPPHPDRAYSDQVRFGKASEGKGNKIENYTVVQTVEKLNVLVLDKYNEEKETSRRDGKSETEAGGSAAGAAQRLHLFHALTILSQAMSLYWLSLLKGKKVKEEMILS